MIGILPKSLEVGDREYEIRSDFRDILRIYSAFQDESLTPREKAYICLANLFPDVKEIPQEDMQEAVDKAYWFVGGGKAHHAEPEKEKLIDWQQDESIIFPAVNKVAGTEVRETDYMHWWTFLGLFGEVGDGLFSAVVNIRRKKAQGKPLDKHEKEFYKKNRHLIDIKTPEDIEAEEELNKVLSELIEE